jgi:purine-binding chemotaxis protein CheW
MKKKTKTAKTKAPEPEKPIFTKIRVLEFNIGTQYFGMDASVVTEVISMVYARELPKSPGFFDGIVNVRGNVVPLINLCRMLQFEDRPYNADNEIIITDTGNTQIGMVVDRVCDIIAVTKEQVLGLDKKTVPFAKFLFGFADLEKGLMPLFDVGKVIKYEQRALSRKGKKLCPITKIKPKEKEILHQRASEFRKRKIEDDLEKRQLIIFSLGAEWYGLDIDQVKEISDLPDIFYIPSAPGNIIGVVNLRGEIISVIDLRRTLGLLEQPLKKDVRMIIAEYHKLKIGFTVDMVADVVKVPVDLIEPPLTTTERMKAEYLDGEAEWENKLFGILNLRNIIYKIKQSNQQQRR